MGIGRALIVAAAAIALVAPTEATADDGRDPRAATCTLTADASALAALGVSLDRLMYHARIEANVVLVTPSSTADLHAFVDPGTDGLSVAITLEHVRSARTDSRVLALADVAVADRARVVALGLAELVRAFGLAPAPRPSVAPPVVVLPVLPQPPTAPDVPPPNPSAPTSSLAFDVSIGALGFPVHGAWLVDPRVGVERRLSGPLWARADLGVWLGGARDPLGTAHLTVPSGGLGVAWRFEPTRRLSLGVGPLLDVGVAFASAEGNGAARATSETTLTLRALLSADVRVVVAGPLALGAGASAGVMIRGAELRADDRVVLAATGLAVAARASAAIVLP